VLHPPHRRSLPFASSSPALERAAAILQTRERMASVPPGPAAGGVRCGRGALRVGGEGQAVRGVGCPSQPLGALDNPGARVAVVNGVALSGGVRLPGRMPGSYRDALIGGLVSTVDQGALDDVALNLSRRLSCERKKHCNPASSLPSDFTAVSDEGWKVAGPC
jgi:hypothetical protein